MKKMGPQFLKPVAGKQKQSQRKSHFYSRLIFFTQFGPVDCLNQDLVILKTVYSAFKGSCLAEQMENFILCQEISESL